jgi:endogenous inhibitor of DNA gyrase (YacG/DUF329 family)
MTHLSRFAGKVLCRKCGKNIQMEEWPIKGDFVPFYYQDNTGNYSLTVNCPHCGEKWYIVWDQDPGSIEPLRFPFYLDLE